VRNIAFVSKRIAAVVVLAGLACLWGVIAFTGQGHEQGTNRFVVENEYDEPRTVTVTIDTPSGRLLTDNTTVMPGEQWVVASVDTSELTDGYTMTVAGEHSSRHQQSRAGPGATLIEMDGGSATTCGDSPSCHRQYALSAPAG
jgi:hypothetical protein